MYPYILHAENLPSATLSFFWLFSAVRIDLTVKLFLAGPLGSITSSCSHLVVYSTSVSISFNFFKTYDPYYFIDICDFRPLES